MNPAFQENIKKARDDLWYWYAFGSWENVDVDVVFLNSNDDSFMDDVEELVRKVFKNFCLQLDHVNDSYGQCVYCRTVIKEKNVNST